MSNAKNTEIVYRLVCQFLLTYYLKLTKKVEELKLKSRSEYIVRFLENKQYKNTL